ncbi:hypothetical protein RCM72_11560, partial [Escherichia marmotae]|nr:hypothetical protein [Escherichia marmotae]
GEEKMPDAMLASLICPAQGYGRGQQRIIPPHTPDSVADTVSPTCPLPYDRLTCNPSLISAIIILLLTKFSVMVVQAK